MNVKYAAAPLRQFLGRFKQPQGKLHPRALATHSFALDRAMEAYDVFGAAATNKAIKVTIAA